MPPGATSRSARSTNSIAREKGGFITIRSGRPPRNGCAHEPSRSASATTQVRRVPWQAVARSLSSSMPYVRDREPSTSRIAPSPAHGSSSVRGVAVSKRSSGMSASTAHAGDR